MLTGTAEMICDNILGTIGSTPMVRLNRFSPNPGVRLLAKLEGFNPTGSIKDRIAVRMVEEAERSGRLAPGRIVIEPTSGNTGIGLAIVGIVKGSPVEIVLSAALSVERREIIRSYGAKVVLTPAAEGTDGAIRYARAAVAAAPDRYFMPDRFANAGNHLAHYQSTAREIIAREGIFAGMSSGAALQAAVRTAARIERGNIEAVFPDRAEKYLSATMSDEFND